MTDRTHPKHIGPYRILELKGEGAFGLVYLAEQQEPVRRKVAIKVLKRGMDTDEVLARFEAERQALALMSHPNIAQIFDAGATGHGLSYFVMEYVQGEPINEYCDNHKLDVRARVELFRSVCEALQHAHQKGIIHRDLKPSNVLVALQEGRAIPKVIDFGIAKAMHQRLTDKTLYTSQGQFVGTPGYMSPEQALADGLDVDTTTDIYSLGVMLYELLTGVLPLDLRLLAMDAMLKTLRDSEPPTLGERLTKLGEKAERVAEARGVDVKTLRRMLSGDLKWVVTRALEKERARRYQSASELAAELGRYLANEPVLAGPPGAAYQLKKFVSRHRGPVAVAALLLVLLTGFSVVLGVQLQRVAAEAERANRGEATAEQVSDFLVGLFEVSDPSEALGNTITAREILDEGAERIETELADQPLVQARLMHSMGQVYEGLGLYEPAAALLEQAVALRERELGASHLDLATSLDELGEAYEGLDRSEEAEAVVRRGLAIRERALGPDHPDVAVSLANLGTIIRHAGRYAEAEAPLVRALAIRDAALDPDHVDVAGSLGDLGDWFRDTERYAEAEPLYLRAVAIRERALGPNHPRVASTMNDLATLYRNTGRYEEAEALYLRALAIKEEVLGPDHRSTGTTLSNLGIVYRRMERYDEAEALYLRALAIQENALGPNHFLVSTALNNLAVLYRTMERYVDAEPLYLRALAIRENTRGPDHPRTATVVYNLGRLYAEGLRRYEDAETLYARALAIREAALGEDSPSVADVLEAYAEFLREVGRQEEAGPMEERAAVIREASGS